MAERFAKPVREIQFGLLLVPVLVLVPFFCLGSS
jgi:hypothetical protein